MANSTVVSLTTLLSMNNINFKKGVLGSINSINKFQKKISGIGNMIAGAFAVRAVVNFARATVQALDKQLKAQQKVTQAITSTGMAAGYASKELFNMAKELQKITLFGDEDILGGVTAQLLTFTNIAGKEFERTQKVVLDVATVLDQDLKTTAIQLGKALNDPVANLGALGRSGIQFSKDQKVLIKSLWEVGRRVEAQRLILEELERQYGGQAEAAALVDVTYTQLKNQLNDVKEVIGKGLMGAVVGVTNAFKTGFNPALMATNKAVRDGWKEVERLALELQELKQAMAVGGTAGFFAEQDRIAEDAKRIREEYARIKKIAPWAEPPGFVDAWSRLSHPKGENEKVFGLDWTWGPVDDTTTKIKQLTSDVMKSIDAFAMEGLDKIEIYAEDIPEKVKLPMEDLGKMIGENLIMQFDQLGEAIGKFATGAEGAFNDLGQAILQNLGNILIMMGAQIGPAGLPLLLAGIAMQLGGGIFRGLGNSGSTSIAPNVSNAASQVNFKISGQNLVGVLERQNTKTNMNT